MHKKTNLILPIVLSAVMMVSPVVSSVPVLADDAQDAQIAVTEDQSADITDDTASTDDGTEEVKTHSIGVTVTKQSDGTVSGMYAMENAIVTEQSDGTYLVRMHQSAVNRNLLALTDDMDKATNHEVDWYKGAGDDGYWFVIPVADLSQPLCMCMCSEERVASGKAFGNIMIITFDTTSMADTTEAEVTTDELNILPAETPEPETVIQQLTASSTTAMFKAVSGYVETTDGQSVLHVALSGTGCQDLYPGTYDEAVASTDADPVDTSNWIHYTVNDDGKYEFAIPIEAGQTYVPVVSLSGKYYTSGSKIWYPRQFVIDYENSTLVSGDYDFTEDIAFTNENESFPAASAAFEIIGGPISNNYAQILKLTMSDASNDQAYIGTAGEAAEASSTIALDEANTFALKLMANKQGGTVDFDYLEQPVTVAFHNAETDTWTEGTLTVSKTAMTAVLKAGVTEITAQPESVYAKSGETVSFTVAASNAASYQWYYQKADSTKWTKLSDNEASVMTGTASDTLTMKATSIRMTYTYRCKVTGTDGTVLYTDGVQAMSGKPVITEQPESVKVKKGATVTLSVKADNAVSYRWQYSTDGTTWKTFTNKDSETALVTGATTDTVSFIATSGRLKMSFRCRLAGPNGSVAYTQPVTIK